MADYRVVLTYSATRRIEQHAAVVTAANAAAAETAAATAIAAAAPHLATWAMTPVTALKVVTVI